MAEELEWEFRLADFGQVVQANGSEPIFEGDSCYMAPELLDYDVGLDMRLEPADCFALGITAYELMTPTKKLPITGIKWQQLRKNIISFESDHHENSQTIEDITTTSDNIGTISENNPPSEPLQSIILAMMKSNPARRPTLEDIVSEVLRQGFKGI